MHQDQRILWNFVYLISLCRKIDILRAFWFDVFACILDMSSRAKDCASEIDPIVRVLHILKAHVLTHSKEDHHVRRISPIHGPTTDISHRK